MLYEFQLRNNASAPPRSICAALDESTVADRTCRHWFKRFHEGGISLEDYPRFGRPLACDVERLQALIKDNPRLTTRQLSIVLNCNYSTIDRQLHELGKVNKFSRWVPHQLMPENIQQRITICNSLLLSAIDTGFFSKSLLVTRSDFSMLTIDASVNGSIVDPKPEIDFHPRKMMLSIWWDFQDIFNSSS